MGRKVKYYDTGEIAEKTPEAFQAPDKKWFSNYDAYLEYDLNNQIRNKCIDKMFELMNYHTKQKISTIFFKRLKEWREGYTYDTILKAMELSTESIEYTKRVKDFDNENSKLMYFMAIIQNNLNDAQKIHDLEHRVNSVENNKDLDMFVDGIEITKHICGNIKANDVSHLVGDL